MRMIDAFAATRVQLSRRKGWRMPENTVSVARPTKYGNPFQIIHVACLHGGMCWEVRGQVPAMPGAVLVITADHIESKHAAAQTAVDLFRQHCFMDPGVRDVLRATLAGKNLACWCPLDQPCHADVLLEIANGTTPPETNGGHATRNQRGGELITSVAQLDALPTGSKITTASTSSWPGITYTKKENGKWWMKQAANTPASWLLDPDHSAQPIRLLSHPTE